ncbi:methylmalonyl-CoA epimerase [Membranihabitans marinus]|uniref:methylmalonyl-CoA epimerase n=1 Tax=Membranihabitans marinus TaxID=1227546 RepID=UPI001F1DC725|nr:methylmalonyl-CoA epimerase [Membranihabitans marinus]
MKLEHIGIAVKDLEESEKLFASLFNSPVYKREYVDTEKVETAFIQIENTKIELLSATEGPIAKFIDRKGPGIHHLAFQVDHLESEIKRLQAQGFEFVSETIKEGADNKRVVFLHPRSSGKVLIELVEDMGQ